METPGTDEIKHFTFILKNSLQDKRTGCRSNKILNKFETFKKVDGIILLL